MEITTFHLVIFILLCVWGAFGLAHETNHLKEETEIYHLPQKIFWYIVHGPGVWFVAIISWSATAVLYLWSEIEHSNWYIHYTKELHNWIHKK